MKPWIIFNVAMSLDGKIGKSNKEISLSNKLNEDRIANLRSEVDAILIDVKTIDTFLTKKIKKQRVVIVDLKGENINEIINEIKRTDKHKNLLITIPSNAITHGKLKKLKEKDKINILISGEFTVNLHKLMDKLYRKGIRKVLLEDSGHLAERMLREGLIDEFFILINPLLIGSGINLIEKLKNKDEINLSLKGIVQYGDHVLLHYLSA